MFNNDWFCKSIHQGFIVWMGCDVLKFVYLSTTQDRFFIILTGFVSDNLILVVFSLVLLRWSCLPFNDNVCLVAWMQIYFCWYSECSNSSIYLPVYIWLVLKDTCPFCAIFSSILFKQYFIAFRLVDWNLASHLHIFYHQLCMLSILDVIISLHLDWLIEIPMRNLVN